MFVETIIGGRVLLNRVIRDHNLTILDRTFAFDFIILEMSGFDIILGIDWLSSFQATIDYYWCKVSICNPKGDCFQFTRDRYRVVDPYVNDQCV